jgi:ubiquinone biosynthesis monooxygenase Coq7
VFGKGSGQKKRKKSHYVAMLQQFVFNNTANIPGAQPIDSSSYLELHLAMNLILTAADTALRTLFAKPHAAQACPTLPDRQTELSDTEKLHAAALMRVNHVGEVCAQALYTAQALATSNPALRAHFTQACNEETSHLAWTEQRLQELGSHKSLLNPLWYAGAFGLGLVAGKLGDPISLGFVVETEKQVGAHLQSHLAFGKHGLPEGDHASRAIVSQMFDDEMRHAKEAQAAGAKELPQVVKGMMRAAAKVMTTVAHRV